MVDEVEVGDGHGRDVAMQVVTGIVQVNKVEHDGRSADVIDELEFETVETASWLSGDSANSLSVDGVMDQRAARTLGCDDF